MVASFNTIVLKYIVKFYTTLSNFPFGNYALELRHVYGAAWQRVATNANRFAFAKSDLLVHDFSSGHMDPIYLPMPPGLPQLVIVHEIRSFRIARNKSPFQGMTMAIVCVLVQDTWDADLRPTASNSTLHAEERRKEKK